MHLPRFSSTVSWICNRRFPRASSHLISHLRSFASRFFAATSPFSLSLSLSLVFSRESITRCLEVISCASLETIRERERDVARSITQSVCFISLGNIDLSRTLEYKYTNAIYEFDGRGLTDEGRVLEIRGGRPPSRSYPILRAYRASNPLPGSIQLVCPSSSVRWHCVRHCVIAGFRDSQPLSNGDRTSSPLPPLVTK